MDLMRCTRAGRPGLVRSGVVAGLVVTPRRPCRLVAATLALGLLLPAVAQAGGFSMSVMGTRRTGMLTNIASPDDVAALFHNPAGLADQPGLRLHLSNQVALLKSTFYLQQLDPGRFPAINPGGCGEPGNDPCPWPVDAEGYYAPIQPEKYFGVVPYLGLSSDLGFIDPGLKDLVVSAAVYSPNAYGAFLPENAPTAYHLISGWFLVVAGTVGAGWRVNEHLAIGANLSYNNMRLNFAQKFSTIDALTPAGEDPTLETILAQALLGDLRLDFSGSDHGLGWGAGLVVDLSPRLRLGASYTGATPAKMRGPVHINALADPDIDEQEFRQLVAGFGYKLPYELQLEMIVPHSLFAGLAWEPADWLELNLDLRVWFYQFYREQRLTPFYDPDESGVEPLTAEGLTRPKRYHDSWDICLGVLARPFASLPGLELMAGIGFDRSPIPDRYFTLDNPSLDQIQSAVGGRWQLDPTWRLGASLMVIRHLPRDVRDSVTSPPTNARGSAWGFIPGFEVEAFL